MPVAELWLVHASSNTTDETRRTTAGLGSSGHQFTFAPLLLQTSTGTVTVTVQGIIESGMSTEGQEQFHFSANRTVTYAPAGRPVRDVRLGVESSTKITMPMPGPTDVLSFELPPLTIPGGSVLPDRLSIRVRLSSQPMTEVEWRARQGG
jgi:hypothetical protein